MDELQISGKRFISSRRVAKENGYHTDYIGQLIRANKIKGQKVGRAWYVEAESFAKFLGEEPTVPAQEFTDQESSEVLGLADTGSDVADVGSQTLRQTPVQQTPAAVADVVPTPAPAPEPTPIVVHVQPGYIPSVPFTQSQPTPIVAKPAVQEPAHVEIKPVVEIASQPAVHIAKEEEDTFNVPLRKVAAAPVGGLRYVSEEASLPEIPRSHAITRQMPKLEVEEEAPLPAAPAPLAVVSARKSGIGRTLALVGVAAIAIFAISAVVSSGLFQTINIEAGNPASVGYTIHW